MLSDGCADFIIIEQIMKGVVTMNLELLKKQWLSEEHAAHIHGWDFSHIAGRYEECQISILKKREKISKRPDLRF